MLASCFSPLSSTEDIEDTPSTVDAWQPTAHCHGNDRIPWTRRNEKQVAKRKLMITCAVSLIFMVGEVIGKTVSLSESSHLLRHTID